MEVSLVLTHACNLACTYCYTGDKKQVAMPRDVALAALDLAFSLEKLDDEPLVLGFFGGEPLLEWELLCEVAAAARDRAHASGRELVLQLTTNGTLLSRARAATLEALGVHVALSLDGTREAHDASRLTTKGGGSHAAARRAMTTLLEARTAFDVISVVHPGNVALLEDGVRELMDAGARRVMLNVDFGAGARGVPWSEDALAELRLGYLRAAAVMVAWWRRGRAVRVDPIVGALVALAKGHRAGADLCGAGQSSVAVAPSGRLYGCARSVGEDLGERAIGHVRTGFAARVATSHDVSDRGPRACGSCESKDRCERGTARAACEEETGDPRTAGPVLCAHQGALEDVARRVTRAMLAERNRIYLAMTGMVRGIDEEGIPS
ncbi:MAG: radical SAM protein [Polyangiaceae bacterium]